MESLIPARTTNRMTRGWQCLLTALALAALTLLFVAFGAAEGIVSTNDGSHYALTKALAVDQTIQIDRYVNYGAVQPKQGTPTTADYRDVSAYNGHYYSDRPPGTAFLAVPFYWFGELVGRVVGPTGRDLPLHYVLVLPALLGAITTLALYWLARGIGASSGAAALTAVTGVCTTLVLKYATLLYSHIAGAALVTAALATLLLTERRPGQRWPLVVSGLLLGASGVAEYPNLLLIGPCLLYLGWLVWRRGGAWATPMAFLAGWLPPIALLAGYQWLAFGRPWRTSYTFQYYFEWSHSPATTYVTPPLEGLRWLLFSEAGLFAVTPTLLLALWGLWLLARRSPARAALLLAVVVVVVVPTALHRTYYGGGSNDTRYLLAIVPTLYAPLALWLDWLAQVRQRVVQGGLVAVLAGGVAWGLSRAYASLLTIFGHRAREYSLSQAWTLLWKGGNWHDPAVITPGIGFVPSAMILVIPLIGLLGLGWCWLSNRRQ